MIKLVSVVHFLFLAVWRFGFGDVGKSLVDVTARLPRYRLLTLVGRLINCGETLPVNRVIRAESYQQMAPTGYHLRRYLNEK